MQYRKPHPHLEGQSPASPGGLGQGRLPTMTKKPGNSGAAQALEKGSPGGRPGAGKLPPTPAARFPAGCAEDAGGGAGSHWLRTARTGQRHQSPRGTTGQWRQGAARIVAEWEPLPHSGTGDKTGLREGGREKGPNPRRKNGLCSLRTAAESHRLPSRKTTPRSPIQTPTSGPAGLASRLRPARPARGQPGRPHQG